MLLTFLLLLHGVLSVPDAFILYSLSDIAGVSGVVVVSAAASKVLLLAVLLLLAFLLLLASLMVSCCRSLRYY